MNTLMNVFLRFLIVLLLISDSLFTASGQQPLLNDINPHTKKQHEFIQFNKNYVQMKAQRVERIHLMMTKVRKLESSGFKSYCSHQILWEIGTMIMQRAVCFN
jgi:hypothetical protein